MLLRMASARSPISVAPLASAKNGGADRGRLLAARIVVGDDDAVGILSRDAAHDRAFARVAVAAGAEHHDQFAFGIGPQRLQRLRQRVRLVRVVDEDRRAVVVPASSSRPLAPCSFSSAANTRAARAGGNGEAGGDRGILHLEAADQRQLDLISLAAMRDADDLREAVDRAAEQFDVVALLADRHDLEAALFRRLDHLPGIAIVDADHRGAAGRDQVGEQPQLGGEIGLDGRMIIEMIARQIGEGAGGDAHAVEPVLVEPVRGRLQRQMRDALAGQPGRACGAVRPDRAW